MQLRKIILGLAAVTMLASCGAKDITKAEAIKIAQENYDASNQVYKSCHYKLVTEVKYSENVPEAERTKTDSVQEGDITSADEIADYRLTSAVIEQMDEKVTTFKADGKKLEIHATQTSSGQVGGSLTHTATLKVDEIGYYLEEIGETKSTTIVSGGATYEITIKATCTYTWTK